jgi:hypothetical protein
VPAVVMVKPRQPREARSRTAQTRETRGAGLARQPADHFDAAAGLADGAFDEVGVADAVPVLSREAQVDGQCLPVVEQAPYSGRVGRGVGGREGVDTLLGKGFSARARLDVVGHVEHRPVRLVHLVLGVGGNLGQEVASSVDVMPMSE